jgi:hypothetical protein
VDNDIYSGNILLQDSLRNPGVSGQMAIFGIPEGCRIQIHEQNQVCGSTKDFFRTSLLMDIA